MSSINPLQKLWFNEVYDGAFARLTKVNAKHYLSIIDIIKITCKIDGKAANQKWHRDISDERKMELTGFTERVKFPGTFSYRNIYKIIYIYIYI